MLFRRYGNRLHSVQPDFDARALTEITFRRDRKVSHGAEDFEAGFEKIDELSLVAESEGRVQTEAEDQVLERLESKIQETLEGLGPDEVLLVENEQGVDYPKLRDRKQGIIVDGENRLHFQWWVDPPLRLGRYRPRGS